MFCFNTGINATTPQQCQLNADYGAAPTDLLEAPVAFMIHPEFNYVRPRMSYSHSWTSGVEVATFPNVLEDRAEKGGLIHF